MNDTDQTQRERERLSALLRQLRDEAGLTGRLAAQRAGFSQSKLSKVENGMLLPSEADVRALCRAYRAGAERRREASDLVTRLRDEVDSTRVILQRGAYRKQQEIGRIEAETTLFRDFQPTFILGLVQTPAYVRRVFAGLAAADGERAVAARLQRQTVLRTTEKQFDMIMTEGALRWRAGSADLMIEQLDHVAAVAALPNVRLGIIPWTKVTGVFPGHAFHMYDDRLVIVGTLSATASVRDPRDIALYDAMFEKLREAASFGAGAVKVLRRVRSDYARHG